jgi:hypothetical protein
MVIMSMTRSAPHTIRSRQSILQVALAADFSDDSPMTNFLPN